MIQSTNLCTNSREHLKQDRSRIVRSRPEVRSGRGSESGPTRPLSGRTGRRRRRRSKDLFKSHTLSTDSSRHGLSNLLKPRKIMGSKTLKRNTQIGKGGKPHPLGKSETKELKWIWKQRRWVENWWLKRSVWKG